MAKRKITKKEIDFITKGALIAVTLYFVVEPAKELLKNIIPTPESQLIFGVFLLIFATYFWDLRKTVKVKF